MHAQPNPNASSLETQPASSARQGAWWKPWERSQRRSKGPATDSPRLADAFQHPARYSDETLSEDDAFLQRIRRAGL